MRKTSWILGATLLAAASLMATSAATSAPLSAAGKAMSGEALASGDGSDFIVKTQGRRVGGGRAVTGGRVGGGRVVVGGGRIGGGRVVGGGRAFRGGGGWGRRGIDPGAAAAVGIIGGVIGAMGAAAAADAGPVYGPAPVYGGCYWVRRPVYDDWGNYIGRQKMRVCD